MRIVKRIKVEDCFDGSAVFTYEVSEPWTAQRARRLAALGQFQYFADFPRPLFRLRTAEGLFVNGVEGACDCRVVLPRTNRERVQCEWEAALMSVDDKEVPSTDEASGLPTGLRPSVGQQDAANGRAVLALNQQYQGGLEHRAGNQASIRRKISTAVPRQEPTTNNTKDTSYGTKTETIL